MAKKPVLYITILSPPVRSVLLTAKEIGVELELKDLNLFKGEHLTPDFQKLNPQHTVPTLDDNGTILYDSHVICGYLVDKYAKNDELYPKDLVKRSKVQEKLYFDTGFIFARLRFLYEPILFKASKDLPVDKIANIQKSYDIMEVFLKDQTYLCGDHMTIADLCCVASISSVDEAAPVDKTKYPKLMAWMNRLAQLPYYKEANGDGADALQKLVKEKIVENRAK